MGCFMEPYENNIINAKLSLLLNGVKVDVDSMRNIGDRIEEKYKINQLKISDRHFISPSSKLRNYIPDELIIKEGDSKSIVKVYYNMESPLTLYYDGELKVKDERSGDMDVGFELVKLPEYIVQGKKDGVEDISSIVSVVGMDRLSIIPYSGCHLWEMGKPCKFCGANTSRLNIKDSSLLMSGLNKRSWNNMWKEKVASNVSTALEYLLKYDFPLKPHNHLMFIGGNLENLDFMWELYDDVINMVSEKIDLSKVDSYITLMPPKNLTLLNGIKEKGIQSVMFNLEVFDKKAFWDTCPGKEIQYGYDSMINALKASVDLFGEGQVRTNFVLGAEPLEDAIYGAKKVSDWGIVPDYSIFYPRPGSLWANKNPPSEKFVVEFNKALKDIYKEYSFQPFSCNLSSRSSIINDILYFGE